ncbi:MAG: hypothetical protein ACP5MD_13435, partial [Verrucomicrobiia bacterium]
MKRSLVVATWTFRNNREHLDLLIEAGFANVKLVTGIDTDGVPAAGKGLPGLGIVLACSTLLKSAQKSQVLG